MIPIFGRIAGNSRNVHAKKKISNNFDEIELQTPSSRQSTFDSPIIPKRSTKLGRTVSDIQATLLELYHVEVPNFLLLI